MPVRKAVDLEIDHEKAGHIELVHRKRHDAEPVLDHGGPEISVEVDDIIEALLADFPDGGWKVTVENMYPVNIGVGRDKVPEFHFDQEMDLRPLNLLLETSQHRCGQDNVPDGAEANDQDFFQRRARFCKIK